MCVVAAKHFKDTGWILVKNRDRNYPTEVKLVQSQRAGIERLFLRDTTWTPFNLSKIIKYRIFN